MSFTELSPATACVFGATNQELVERKATGYLGVGIGVLVR